MRRFWQLATCISGCILLMISASCLDSTKQSRTQSAVEPLPTKPVSLPKVAMTPENNYLCIVCHMDFDDEPITADHVAKNITCTYCHGESVTHMEDETMMTSPDVLYGRTEVEGICSHCHQPHKNTEAVEAFRKKWAGKRRENGRSVRPDSVCTDCHGRHTIARR